MWEGEIMTTEQHSQQQIADAYDMTIEQYQAYRRSMEMLMGGIDIDVTRQKLDEEAEEMLAKRRRV